MKILARGLVAMFLALIVMFFAVSHPDAYASSDGETWKRYGRNVIYFNFSSIPDSAIGLEPIELPNDLNEFINAKYNLPQIQNKEKFSADFWEEAVKLGYSKEAFSKMAPKDAIMAAVKITAARFSYFLVDNNKEFIKKYGRSLPLEEYFHMKLGDCDKYRDATIAGFAIIKDLNPKLKNIYLTSQELGGRGMVTMHAWVAIVISAEKHLILSHIDPTFYDSGGKLEADKFHITLKNDVFQASFYYAMAGRMNVLCAYDILLDAYLRADGNHEREDILCRMVSVTHSMSIYDAETASLKMSFVLNEHEGNKFLKDRDTVWYYAYKVFSAAGKIAEKEKYKKMLLEQYPKSFWTKLVQKEK